MEPLPRLIHSVVVRAEPGVKDFELEIKAACTSLLTAPSWGTLVARERYRFSPHDANLRYFLRSSA
jgi:hypothetical protein